MNIAFITVVPSGIEISIDRRFIAIVHDFEELQTFIKKYNVDADYIGCSSSLEFPSEFTDDPKVIQFATDIITQQ